MHQQTTDAAPNSGEAETKHGAIGHLSADEELQQLVLKTLIEDSELDSSDIGVRVSEGRVVLSGCVRRDQDRQRALAMAGAQRGALAVLADELRVCPPRR